MANSYTQILVHTTFHVKGDNRIDAFDKPALYRYITGIINALSSETIAIGGTSNHIHILFSLPKTISLSEFIMKIKANSSRWLKDQGTQYRAFAWQDGYGAFSVSASVVAKLKDYINNQEEHHRKVSYKEEVKRFFDAYHIDYDERYI